MKKNQKKKKREGREGEEKRKDGRPPGGHGWLLEGLEGLKDPGGESDVAAPPGDLLIPGGSARLLMPWTIEGSP